jgi:hypothetical protein
MCLVYEDEGKGVNDRASATVRGRVIQTQLD